MFSLIFTSYQALTNQCVWIYIYVVSYHFYFVPSSQCPLSYCIFMSSLCCMSILRIIFHVCMHAKSLQSCLTLSDPKNSSLPGCSVHGILQARMLEWGCHALLQGMFFTQGLNLHLLQFLHCRRMLYRWATGEACISCMKLSK